MNVALEIIKFIQVRRLKAIFPLSTIIKKEKYEDLINQELAKMAKNNKEEKKESESESEEDSDDKSDDDEEEESEFESEELSGTDSDENAK